MSVEVVFAYSATESSQLSLKVGEKITVHRRSDGGWWIGSNEEGKMGVFPSSYTKPIRDKPKFNVTKEAKTSMLSGPSLASSTNGRPGSAESNSGGGGTSDHKPLTSEEEMAMAESLGLGREEFTIRSSGPMDTLIAKKKEIAAFGSDIDKLSRKRRELRGRLDEKEAEINRIHREVTTLKGKIREKSNSVADKEQELEVLRCALEGLPIPDYKPGALEERNQGGARTPTAESGGNLDVGSGLTTQQSFTVQAPSSGDDDDEDAETEAVADPTEEDIEADKMGRKIVKKLRKRIAEAEATSVEYERQGAKLQKKIGKHQAALDALGDAPEADEEALPAEAKQEVERLKASVAKTTNKVNKLSEALASNEVFAALEADKKKYEKRLAKGTEASAQLSAEVQRVQADVASATEAAATAKDNKKQAFAARADAKKAVENAKASAASGQQSRESELHHLKEKVAKEMKRITEFEAELQKLIAQVAAAEEAAKAQA